MLQLPDLNYLSDAEKDALIRALWQRLDASERRIAELEAKLGEPPKTPDNSSVPPSKGQKANQPEKAERQGPRHGSLGRRGGGRPLVCDPDETVIAKALACAHCQAALTDAEQVLHGREDRMLPVRSGYYLAEHLPNAQLHVLPHAGHWIQIEQADRFTVQAKLFLAE